MITKIYPDYPDYKALERIARQLEEGAIIIFSTGLAYAFGCNALHTRAVENIYRIKGANLKKQHFAILCADLANAAQYARIDQKAFRYIKEHIEEPITYLLPPLSSLPKVLKGNKEIGIRLAATPETKLLLANLPFPLLTASLPIRHEEYDYLTHPELVDEAYGKEAYTIVDGGIAPGGRTAIVKLEDGEVEMLRHAEEGFAFFYGS